MWKDRIASVSTVILMIMLALGAECKAQWGQPYANSWIRYDQPYVKVTVLKKGLCKIPFSSLPKGFPTNAPEKIQLWRRGKQVSVISTANQEILFYGLPNDGAGDSLLYRPASARINPYFSMYSDEGSYFLTVGKEQGLRAKVVNQPADAKVQELAYHRQQDVHIFQEEYSLSTEISIKPEMLNSYFELGASRTGYKQNRDSTLIKKFKVSHLAASAEKSTIKLLLHGRSNNHRQMEIYVGENQGKLRLAASFATYGFDPAEYTFDINEQDFDENGEGILLFKSISDEKPNRYSLAYFTLEYPQLFDTDRQHYKEFRLSAVTEAWSRIAVKGTVDKTLFFDISEPDNPIQIKGNPANLMVPRQAGKSHVLLAASEIQEVKVKEVSFKAFDPAAADYIIITTQSLLAGAKEYAAYRASPAGGNFKVLIADMADLYNQFNYGEPSPLAIRKFMSYMLAEGGKDKYLFLMGKSITYNERMKRELPDEVPTVGYPGSDVLLVDGLAGEAANYPACPAFT